MSNRKRISGEEQRERMLNRPIPGLVGRMLVPMVVTQLITLIYNTADTYFISHINKSASAAVGAVFAIMALIQAVGFGFGMGSSSLCSRKLGEQKDEQADMYCSSAFFGAVTIGALIMILGLLFLEPLLHLVGCSASMMEYARPYAGYILMTAPIFCGVFVLNDTLRAEGQTALCMLGTLGGGLLNLVLDPLFIFTLNLGTAGAALATSISQIVTFCILAAQFLMKKTILHIRWHNVSKQLSDYGQILTTGFPTILRQGLSSVATAAMCTRAVIYGDSVVAALTIANKCYMLIRFVGLGIGMGFQPVAGYNYGAGKNGRAREAFLFAVKVGTVLCVLFAVVFAIYAEPIMWWFCKDEEVVRYGCTTIRFLCLSMPLLGFSTYVNQLYQCLGFKVQATLLASCRQGTFYLPLVFVLPLFMGVAGVEFAQAGADLLTTLISVPFIIIMFKKYLPVTE